MRRLGAAVMATNLALAFVGLCLASCLAPADAHACCRGKSPAISAATDDCCLETDGVTAAANILPAYGSVTQFVHTVVPSKPVAEFRAPRVPASPPFVLRV